MIGRAYREQRTSRLNILRVGYSGMSLVREIRECIKLLR